MSAEIANGSRHVSLNPPPRRPRESRLESADQAAGIFSLYGGRDSWQSQQSNDGELESLSKNTNGSTNDGGEWVEESNGHIEELVPDNDETEISPTTITDHSVNPRMARLSTVSQTPSVTVTAPNTPNRPSSLSYDLHNSTLSSSTSTSPAHQSVSRLSPRPTQASASASQSSFSSQYPGEEPDAFHVRSTYARLEVEGVYGDGWDEGVERTRERAIVGNRKTVMLPNRGGDVGEKERGFLASLDRYGFVDEPLNKRSETRLALIPSAALSKIPKIPNLSPLRDTKAAAPTAMSMIPSSHEAGPSARVPECPRPDRLTEERGKRKEAERVGKWAKMMTVKKRDEGGNILTWGWSRDGEGSKLPRRVYKGIPDRWRMAAWWTLAEAKADEVMGKGKRTAESLIEEYASTLGLPNTFDVQIDLDIPRTISGHQLFITRYGKGQVSMFNVLHSYSLYCETCGYCQGMGPIAATLLLYLGRPDRVYTLLVRLHDVYGMHSIFAPGFPGLLEAIYVQERMMEYILPDVYRAFQKHMISGTSYCTKWYITIFSNTVPFATQLRIWDGMFLDGRDVMIITSLAILFSFKDLLSAPTANFESILSLLSSNFVCEDEDLFLKWIDRMINQEGVRERMEQWRLEWKGLVESGKSGEALL